MKSCLLILVALAVIVWMLYPRHEYAIRQIDTPQADGSVAHDFARVNLETGTMCSVHEPFWFEGSFVESCK